MNLQFLLGAQLMLALLLMWTCFCRAIKTDPGTHREVRWAIWFEGVAAGLVFGAPLLPLVMRPGGNHWTPTWAAWTTPYPVWLLLLLAVLLVQLVTAKYWASGQAPVHFQRPASAAARGVVFAAMLLVVGGASLVPVARAQEAQPAPGPWRPVDGDVVQMPKGGEVKCLNAGGCVVFTAEALRAVLRRAASGCARPSGLAPRGSRT